MDVAYDLLKKNMVMQESNFNYKQWRHFILLCERKGYPKNKRSLSVHFKLDVFTNYGNEHVLLFKKRG